MSREMHLVLALWLCMTMGVRRGKREEGMREGKGVYRMWQKRRADMGASVGGSNRCEHVPHVQALEGG
jgi:predicted aminopeptidase